MARDDEPDSHRRPADGRWPGGCGASTPRRWPTWEITPAQSRALRVLAVAMTAMRPSVLADRAADRAALGHRGGRRAGGARLGAPRTADPTDRRATTPGAHRRRPAAGAADRRRTPARPSERVLDVLTRARIVVRSTDPDRRRGGGRVTVRVGLTGGIASGKSTVSAMLAELGAVVIDADAARARGRGAGARPGWPRSWRSSAPSLLTPDGDLDRAGHGCARLRRRRGAQAAGGDRAPAGASSAGAELEAGRC